jgi:hypothetical protein
MTDLESIRNDVLREMYDEAEPGLDFDEVLANPESVDEDWYAQHTLDGDRQQEIVEKHAEKHNLSEKEHTALVSECILNLGPATPAVNTDSA